ncbi:MAG: hypothetical protein K2M87_03295 [Muribaculaceae bacterium]|nr:hypothetical protein [Muribaculaceae bacterium]
MKTFKSLFFKGSVAVMLLIIMTACGAKAPTAEQVNAKIEANQALTEADYSEIIDYCGKYAKEAQKYYNDINAQPNDSTTEAIAATNALAELYAVNPYLDNFSNALMQTTLADLGEKNAAKVNEYAQYEAFPLPGGEGQKLENRNVVGVIEETPDSDTTGVISQGDGEAVNINVK